MNRTSNEEVTFAIKEHLGIINSYETGWTRELNIVSWNDGADRYDIRDWNPDHERMSRGITLDEEEMRAFTELLSGGCIDKYAADEVSASDPLKVTFAIKEHLGVLSYDATGWTKELNIISWNGGLPKYDVRSWDEDHERMSRGATFKSEEAGTITDLYNAYKKTQKKVKASSR